MAETAKPASKKATKGGSKGGARFPRLDITEALEYSKKLVSKTHNGPQPEKTIFVGVFNNKGPLGGVRASALKQYGLMDGDAKGYIASGLAREIEAALPAERQSLVRKAFLTPKLFKQVYETLQSETASGARVRQVVITGDVHPENADACVKCFIDGAVYTGLGTMDGESIVLVNAAAVATPATGNGAGDDVEAGARTEAEAPASSKAVASASDSSSDKGVPSRASKPGLSVSINVDSTSDPDKLEKQLKLLREFGVI